MTARLIDGKAIGRRKYTMEWRTRGGQARRGREIQTHAGNRAVGAWCRVEFGDLCKVERQGINEGMGSVDHHLPADISQAELEKLIKSLNE